MLNPRQKLVLEKPHKIRAYVCGYGAGKTYTSVVETYYQMTLVHPGFCALVCVPQVSHIVSWINVWKMVVPQEQYEYVRGNQQEIRMTNGSVIYLRHTNDGGYNYAGLNVAFLAIDEAALILDKEAYSAALARLRAGNRNKELRVLLTTTPNGYNWFADTFGTGADSTVWFGDDGCWENEEKTICVVRGRTSDNAINLAPDYEANLRSNNTPEWCAQYLDGQFLKSKSQVFHYFDPAKHIVDPKDIPTTAKKIVFGVDFGWNDPGVFLGLSKTGTGKIYVFCEEYHKGKLYDKDGWYGLAKQLQRQYKVQAWYCDPSEPAYIAGLGQAVPAGYFYRANNEIAPGLNLINTLLNKGLLFISSDCKKTIKEMQSYRYKEIRGESTNIPMSGNDHTLDCLRYALLTDLD